MMKINNQFSIGQAVYITSDPEQVERQVVYITVTPIGLIYGVACGAEEVTDCFEIELSDSKKVM